MTSIDDLEKRVARIEGRNKNVELDNAIGFYLSAIQIKEPWLNAIVPSFGFLLSTLTLPFFKNLWKKYFYKNE
ncbi:MAG: hypothetical protein HYW64_00195 [Candidatus Levybacteria bacterium]|nr:hypothetical protein [Candidatus Levybacteria bacterium]